MKRREEMTFLEKIYVWEIFKGICITFGNLLRNFGVYLARVVGLGKNKSPWVTVEYPDAVRAYPASYRGRHRLTLKQDGSVKCTACFLCATACPARCIYIEPAEHPDPHIEKYPNRYEIDTLLCVYCGFCVDACPVDAIRMDTGIHPEVYSPYPRAFVETKEVLMERSRVLQEKGVKQFFQEHMQRMREIEKHPFADNC
ncbi:MAG: 4Fe-4S dicluster domain-containing protein [Deltaproteobacteria bacterium]|nr:4Fe-4S dicluster domain-containing protein [Deltaproteobacteria bacterium]